MCFRDFPGFHEGRPDILRGIKGFFVAFFNASSPNAGIAAWSKKHPELAGRFLFSRFLRQFCRDSPNIHAHIQNLFPDIATQAAHDRVSATSRILFHCEDTCLEILGWYVREMGGEIGGFLNDGLFVWGPSLPPDRAWDLLEAVNILLSSRWGGPIYFTLSPPSSIIDVAQSTRGRQGLSGRRG